MPQHFYRFTGGDRNLSRHPETVAFLAKCYVESAQGSGTWPMFNQDRLGAYLSALGIDLDAATKAHANALDDMPVVLSQPEFSIPMFSGASFLTASPLETAHQLQRRYQLAKLRGAPAAS